MTPLPLFEELFQLLRRIDEKFVVWHNACDIHAPGFSWHGADMSLPSQELCAYAQREGLLDIGVHRDGASQVSLTGAGTVRLTELQVQHNAEVRGVA
jgi:hypothetical protein